MDRGTAAYRFFLRIYQWVMQKKPILTPVLIEAPVLNLPPLNLSLNIAHEPAPIHNLQNNELIYALTQRNRLEPNSEIISFLTPQSLSSDLYDISGFRTWWSTSGRDQTYTQASHASMALALTEMASNEYKLRDYADLEIPDDFMCTISHEIMTNPVYDPAYPQKKYDLLVIKTWLINHDTNPYTRTPLRLDNLVYDETLKIQIDDFVSEKIKQAPSMSSRFH